MLPYLRVVPVLFLGAFLALSAISGCDDHDHNHDHHNGHNHGGSDDHNHGGSDGHSHGGEGGHDHGSGGQAGQGGQAASKVDQLACTALTASPKPLTAVNDPAKAPDAKMTSGETYAIKRASSGASYVSFVNLTEHANWHLYFKEPKALTKIIVGGATEKVPASTATEGCPTELPASYQLHLHEPGVYTLEVAPGPDDLWAFLVEGEAGH
jgi:hypothetical protein